MPSRLTFPEWALGIAKAVSQRSEDPYVKVGSVALASDWRVLGVGYNGLPPGVNMPAAWWKDRDGRRSFMIHAEINALRDCRSYATIWIVGTHIPCATCMSVLGSYGVVGVYYQNQLGEAHDMELIQQIAELNRIKLTRLET